MLEKKYNFDRTEFYIMKNIPIFYIQHLHFTFKNFYGDI